MEQIFVTLVRQADIIQLVPNHLVVIVALATIVQEVVLVINVHQESTRQTLPIQRYQTVAIVALAITVQEETLEQDVALANTRR